MDVHGRTGAMRFETHGLRLTPARLKRRWEWLGQRRESSSSLVNADAAMKDAPRNRHAGDIAERSLDFIRAYCP